jgi:hypothetical protein
MGQYVRRTGGGGQQLFALPKIREDSYNLFHFVKTPKPAFSRFFKREKVAEGRMRELFIVLFPLLLN